MLLGYFFSLLSRVSNMGGSVVILRINPHMLDFGGNLAKPTPPILGFFCLFLDHGFLLQQSFNFM